jgi:alpha-L-rhamnosidase
VSLRYAEVLNANGTIYTANLRSARQTDHYTLSGAGIETYEPQFTFHGFRYVELLGMAGTPTAETLTAIVLHSDTAPSGSFECSDALINQLQHNIVWGQKSNFLDVPTDCPQRDERLGWTGDAQVFIRTATFNMDVAGFFTRWGRDLVDSQAESGAYPPISPNTGIVGGDGGPAWADAGIICPWTLWQRYGDTRVLAEFYPSMQRFIEFLERTSRNLIRCFPEYDGWHGFGDWLALDNSGKTEGRTPHDLIGTAFFAHDAHLMSEIAQVLGKTQDARRYAKLFEQVRQAFVDQYVTNEGMIAGQTQTGYVLALHFNLLPPHLRPKAVAELVRDIRRRGTHLATGFVGTPYLMHVLTEAGELDLAYELLHQRTWPSWLYSVTKGATTIWERWDGWTEERGFQDAGMNSFNHYAYGAVGDWLYAVVAGLDTAADKPGYQHMLLSPRPGGGLTNARASYRTPYGQALSDWRIVDGTFEWDVVVPANSTATIRIPCSDGAQVLEGDIPASSAEGVSAQGYHNGAAIFAIGAGRYRFRVGG